MSAEKDITLDEKRVYGAKSGETELFVATAAGLLEVSVSGALVGEFGLVHRGAVRDVAGGGGLAIATEEDVHLARATDGAVTFEATGFGPAVAVSTREGVVASDGERVARLDADGWTGTCTLGGVRAIDGEFVAADSGVHRLDGSHVGLSAVRDVAARTPLAATENGLYYLGNGWMEAISGAFEVVTADGVAHAATAETLFERGATPGEWSPVDLPVDGRIAGVGHGETTYVVTVDGTLLAYDEAESTWRDRALGLSDVRALAVVGE
jgi:hypothetical protein